MRASLLLAMITLAGLGCRRAPEPAPAPVQLEEDYCWWAVLRSSLPPDSVAARFERAYAAVGLAGVRRVQLGDTAWVQTTPVVLDGVLRASRAVAYRRGDSTHFRYFVGSRESEGAAGPLSLCVRIAQAAAIGWSAPREPTGEESLAVWSRVSR